MVTEAAYAGTLFQGDALEVMRTIPDDSIGLIYADPPFFSGRDFFQGEELAFTDKWENGLSEYLTITQSHLTEMRRVLSHDGTLYVHSDFHSSHYLKVIMDSLFGYNKFLNEIVWKRQSAHCDVKQGSRHFGRIHDSILVYTKSNRYFWNQNFTPYRSGYIDRYYKYMEKNSGRRFALGDLTAPGGYGNGNAYYEFLGVSRFWRYSQKKMNTLKDEGRIYVPSRGKVPKLKRYLDEQNGIPLQDIWEDVWSTRSDGGRIYPTQKPSELLRRIIQVSARPDSIVLDPYAGSGVSLLTAYKLGHPWIGIDISPSAIRIARDRLIQSGAQFRVVQVHDNESTLPFQTKYRSIRPSLQTTS